MYRIMFKDSTMKRALGLGSDGYLVDKKLFQLIFSLENAEKAAEEIRADFPDATVTVSPF